MPRRMTQEQVISSTQLYVRMAEVLGAALNDPGEQLAIWRTIEMDAISILWPEARVEEMSPTVIDYIAHTAIDTITQAARAVIENLRRRGA